MPSYSFGNNHINMYKVNDIVNYICKDGVRKYKVIEAESNGRIVKLELIKTFTGDTKIEGGIYSPGSFMRNVQRVLYILESSHLKEHRLTKIFK